VHATEKLPFLAHGDNILMQKAIHAATKIRKNTKQTTSMCSHPSPREVLSFFWALIYTIWQYNFCPSASTPPAEHTINYPRLRAAGSEIAA
jgi:hypothetical protein